MPAFSPDRCLRTMPGEDLSLVGEVEDAALHRSKQRLPVTTGEIGSAHGTGKELVARKEGFLGWEIKTAVARSMPGGMSHLEGETGQVKELGIDQVGSDLGRRPIPKRARSKEPLQLASRFERQVIVVGMHMDGGSRSPLKGAGPSHVIDVAVGQQQGHRSQVVIVQQLADGVVVGGSVDHHSLPALLLSYHIGVGLGDPERAGEDQHSGLGLGDDAVGGKHPVNPFQIGQKPGQGTGIGKFDLVAKDGHPVPARHR